MAKEKHMKQADFDIRSGGGLVRVQFRCRNRFAAIRAFQHAEDHPPTGYILTSCNIWRRGLRPNGKERGGSERKLQLTYRLTEHGEPLSSWRNWADALHTAADLVQTPHRT